MEHQLDGIFKLLGIIALELAFISVLIIRATRKPPLMKTDGVHITELGKWKEEWDEKND